MRDPEDCLAERVEKYSNWDGELNEMVHFTRRGVNGKDILINILLSDSDDCNNKHIVFNPDFNHFGVNIGIKNTGKY